jgi:hypothetical protein
MGLGTSGAEGGTEEHWKQRGAHLLQPCDIPSKEHQMGNVNAVFMQCSALSLTKYKPHSQVESHHAQRERIV